MRPWADAALRALQVLLRGSHLARADDIPRLVTDAAAELGARRAVVYVIDYDHVLLVPFLSQEMSGDASSLPVDSTLAGRAFRDVTQHVATGDDRITLWAPIVDGTERCGVLELEWGSDVDLDDYGRRVCADLASALAELLVTRSAYGDAIEQTRRRTPLTIPAEVQWKLLPPLTFVCPTVAVAGGLAPATEVAGDSFDYAVNGDIAYVAVIDAMGHGLEAALLSTVAIAALRNARRSGLSLIDTVHVMDSAIASQFGPDKFVTAIIGELHTVTGVWTWTAFGHPPALIVRGGRVVKTLDSVINAPLGLNLLHEHPAIGRERLEPGDRLLLYTDGVVEARDAEGEFFGVQRLVEFISREAAAGQPAAEALRRLNLSILAHQEGELQDDATTVMVEWLTDEPKRSPP